MAKELDEDLIEATIRRVSEAASAAAREAAAPEDAAESEPPPLEGADAAAQERRVQSLVRRVADAKAARLAEPAEPAAPSGSRDHQPSKDRPSVASAPTPDEDDVIEATIRRVAAAKAAQATEAPEPPLADATPAVVREPDAPALVIEPEPEPAEEPAPSLAPTPITSAVRQPRPAAVPSERPGESAAADGAMLTALRRDLDELRATVAALSSRVDELSTIRERPAPTAESPRASGPGTGARDEEWDDSPTMPRIAPGQAPRPAIFRDGPASAPPREQVAGAARLSPAPGDDDAVPPARSNPVPLTTGRPETRRGLDLLPRTYRVTVEDKRRGVDLVPLHRALLGMDGVRDMSLLSYSNGVAIVSLDTLDELPPDGLCDAIARAMGRKAEVEVHNEATMVVKLAGD